MVVVSRRRGGKRIGSGKLVVITVISALLSGFVQHQFSGPWFGGLSGVVYALMGYVWLRGERDPQSGIYLQRGLILFSLVWLIAGWFDVSAWRSLTARMWLVWRPAWRWLLLIPYMGENAHKDLPTGVG